MNKKEYIILYVGSKNKSILKLLKARIKENHFNSFELNFKSKIKLPAIK